MKRMTRKTWIYSVVILFTIIMIILFILMRALGLNPFLRIMAEGDYEKNKAVFEEIIFDYKDEEIVVTKENYDKSSTNLVKLFEKMDYEFI